MDQLTFPAVRRKVDFTNRYKAGEFGNASPSWDRLDQWLRAGPWPPDPDLKFHLRNRVVASAAATYYDLTVSEVLNLWPNMACPADWYLSQMVPKSIERRLLIQGEVQQASPHSGRYGLELFYSCTPGLPMRPGLKHDGRQTHGAVAVELLRYFLCANSYEWLTVLLDRYPFHVVEFSTFAVPWGTLAPRFNTVFWEVRDY